MYIIIIMISVNTRPMMKSDVLNKSVCQSHPPKGIVRTCVIICISDV